MIDPTAWASSANSGGNRLFCQAYWKKDGSSYTRHAPASDYYIRGDEDWAPQVHKVHSNVTEITVTRHLHPLNTPAMSPGNEIHAFQINAANSDIKIGTPKPTATKS